MDSKWFIVKLISVLFEHQKTTEVSLFHNMLYKFLLLTSKKIWYLLIHVAYLKSVFVYVNKLLDNVYLITNINGGGLKRQCCMYLSEPILVLKSMTIGYVCRWP